MRGKKSPEKYSDVILFHSNQTNQANFFFVVVDYTDKIICCKC